MRIARQEEEVSKHATMKVDSKTLLIKSREEEETPKREDRGGLPPISSLNLYTLKDISLQSTRFTQPKNVVDRLLCVFDITPPHPVSVRSGGEPSVVQKVVLPLVDPDNVN